MGILCLILQVKNQLSDHVEQSAHEIGLVEEDRDALSEENSKLKQEIERLKAGAADTYMESQIESQRVI